MQSFTISHFSWDIGTELQAIESLWAKVLGNEPKTVCDVGAGTGRFLIPMLQKRIECIAVEPDSSMVAVLLEKLSKTVEAIDCPTVLTANFEDVDGVANLDCIIAMTDVISYRIPPHQVASFCASVLQFSQGWRRSSSRTLGSG